MSHDVTCRSAAPRDAEAVAKVLIASRAAYLPCAPMAHGPSEVGHWVAEVLAPGDGVTVAEHRGEVVGVLATSHDGRFS